MEEKVKKLHLAIILIIREQNLRDIGLITTADEMVKGIDSLLEEALV